MCFSVLKRVLFILNLACCDLLPARVFAQAPVSTDVRVFVQREDGSPVDQMATVTVSSMTGPDLQQAITRGGRAEFNGLKTGSYNLEVVALGYDRAVEQLDLTGPIAITVTIRLKQASDRGQPTPPAGPPILAPNAKKELGKALEALRAKKPAEARRHLDVAYRLAPGNPDVNYLFGVYSAETSDWTKAEAYWEKVLNLYPKHFDALLSLGVALLRENKSAEAARYLNGAVEAEPTSWRAHALLADAYLRQSLVDDSVLQAERALELGHGQATTVQPLLARALARRGNKQRAIHILETYLQDHPGDASAKKQLENVQVSASEAPAATSQLMPLIPADLAISSLPLYSSWLPPDVDEKMPPVEPGAACALDEVMKNSGKRVEELVGNVDRFTATEFLRHETIDKWGVAGARETREFEYVVSIEKVRPGIFNVQEYRNKHGSPTADFPGGVATNGLPTMALIFHPDNAVNFEITCEGMVRWNGALVWQLHFRQRSDKPNTMRAYRLGVDGPRYFVALKGRAWIAADSYQIMRVETDLIAPVPQIRLAADHTIIEYGPVRFRDGKVDMWLPQSAEVYYDWRGRRSHRRHSFSNYLLFSVGENQHISVPKAEDASPTGGTGEVAIPKP
jgi:Flp pilus assembly protein TadD